MGTYVDMGTTFRRRGQQYEIVGEQPHTLRNGRTITMWRLRSCCADCGRPFEFVATKTRVRRREDFNRRCERHRRPGVRVCEGGSTRARTSRANVRRNGSRKRRARMAEKLAIRQ
jgi:hypothetical protein